MKTPHSTTPGLQSLTPADLAFIRALAERDTEGLSDRCARYRRRATIRRYAVAACIFLGCCISYSSAMAAPLYEQITTSGESDNQDICDTIRRSIENVS